MLICRALVFSFHYNVLRALENIVWQCFLETHLVQTALIRMELARKACNCNYGKVGSFADCSCIPFLTTDINECLDSSVCSHTCINTFGSYECICPVGYDLYPTAEGNCVGK